MIVRQEILIAEIIARDRDPADAFQLLKQMEDLVRAIHESIALFEARRH
jgi:hypothetical protein